MESPVKYSVTIPIFNEEGSVVSVFHSLREVMGTLGVPYEIVFVDDASTDSGIERLKNIPADSKGLVVVALAGRVGQTEALQAGFDNAKGEILITLDGDGQYEPRDIPRLLDKLKEGYDVVYGWRFQRQDPLLKIASSKVVYIIRRLTTKEKIHDVGCFFRVFRKKDIEDICLWGGLQRFFSTIMAKKGCRVGEVRVIHYPRKSGVSKYGIWDRLKEGTADLFRIYFTDIDTLMDHKRRYKIKEILRT